MKEQTVSIYWLIDSQANVPFFCGKAADPHARLRKLLTDAWRCATPRDRYIHRIGVDHVRLHIVAQLPTQPSDAWRERLASSIATIKHAWPGANTNVAEKGIGGPRERAKPAPISVKPVICGQAAEQIRSNRKKRRFRWHRRNKRPDPGAPAPRGSFRSDGSSKW